MQGSFVSFVVETERRRTLITPTKRSIFFEVHELGASELRTVVHTEYTRDEAEKVLEALSRALGEDT